ncbi:helix-turn-helix domain-containing protein [Agrobacterium sp. NPDC090283]|uniref:helix-turn-helix domain-containing protein n=1 Tax=Agrobacterium sp. NPDC090283 TaxID=3363920 RepID=UPI00383A6607
MGTVDVTTRHKGEKLYLSTSAYAEKQRLSFWQDVIRRHLSPSEFKLSTPADLFNAKLKSTTIGKFTVCEVSSAPVINVRDERCLKKLPDDDYFVALNLQGRSQLIQDERVANLESGDVVLYESARPFRWEHSSPSEMIFARIPRRYMLARLPKAEKLTAKVIKGNDHLASLISSTMREMAIFRADLDERTSSRLGNAFMEIVTTSIEAKLALQENDKGGDVLARAKSYLRKNLDDFDMDLQALADHLGVSPRTIARAFAADQTTPMRWLWEERLTEAMAVLSSGGADNVSSVAMQCGFNDFSHFSRSFRSRFSVTPKSVLRAERA